MNVKNLHRTMVLLAAVLFLQGHAKTESAAQPLDSINKAPIAAAATRIQEEQRLTPELMQKAITAYDTHKAKNGPGTNLKSAVDTINGILYALEKGAKDINSAIGASLYYRVTNVVGKDNDFNVAVEIATKQAARGPLHRKEAMEFLTELNKKMKE